MSDPTTTLATQTGIDPGTIQKGLGALLTFLKDHLSAEHFERVQSAVAGASEKMEAYATSQDSASPGLLGTVANLAGNLLGGKAGEGANLVGMLSKAGLDAGQIQSFLTG